MAFFILCLLLVISETMNINKYTNQVFFFVVLISVVVYRYFVLLKFGFEHTDSDQAIMWQGLQDYSKGVFHEPRF